MGQDDALGGALGPGSEEDDRRGRRILGSDHSARIPQRPADQPRLVHERELAFQIFQVDDLDLVVQVEPDPLFMQRVEEAARGDH